MYAKFISESKEGISKGDVRRIHAKKDEKYILKGDGDKKFVCVDACEIELINKPKFF